MRLVIVQADRAGADGHANARAQYVYVTIDSVAYGSASGALLGGVLGVTNDCRCVCSLVGVALIAAGVFGVTND